MTGPKIDLGLTALPGEWRFDAACTPATGDQHHPTPGGDTRQAKKRCKGCPVRDQCLTHALDHDEPTGIWGGLTRAERKALKRRGLTTAPVVMTDNTGRLLCEHCDRTFAYAARLRQHLDRQHPEEGVA